MGAGSDVRARLIESLMGESVLSKELAARSSEEEEEEEESESDE